MGRWAGVMIGCACLLTAVAGCASKPLRSVETIRQPDQDLSWVEGDPGLLFPRERYFVGIGTCGPDVTADERMSCAMQRALGQAVAMVRQNVQVEIRRRTALHRHSDRNGFQTSVSSTFEQTGLGQAELSVDDTAPRKRACATDGRCHALVALDRVRMARASSTRMAALQGELRGLLDGAERADALGAIVQLSLAGRIAERIEREAELFAAIAGPGAEVPSMWDRLRAVQKKRLGALGVCMTSNLREPAPSIVFSRARQDLARKGFAYVSIAAPDHCLPDSVQVSLSGASLERTADDGLWVLETRGTLVMRLGTTSLGAGAAVLGRGVAHRREQARTDSHDDLAVNVQQSLLELLEAPEVPR